MSKSNIHILKIPDSKILKWGRQYKDNYLEVGQYIADNWLISNVPPQLHQQVKKAGLAYVRKARKNN